MNSSDRRALGFVRALLSGGQVRTTNNDLLKVHKGDRDFSLSKTACAELVSAGVISIVGDKVKCTKEARNWIHRRLANTDEAFTAQHRTKVTDNSGISHNLDESPLKRMANAIGAGTKPYLLPHHIEAGERILKLIERAQLRSRTTMSYKTEGRARNKAGGNSVTDISDQAVDARRQLDRIHKVLPAECVGVVVDVCGFEKGLQLVESERGWPRRSAKLVLRIGLEQLAIFFGLAPIATGREQHINNVWMAPNGRPTELG